MTEKAYLVQCVTDALDAIEIDCPEHPTMHIAVSRLQELQKMLPAMFDKVYYFPK